MFSHPISPRRKTPQRSLYVPASASAGNCRPSRAARLAIAIAGMLTCTRALVLPVALHGADAPAQIPAPADEFWQVAYLGKSRMGYGRLSSQKVNRAGIDLIVSETDEVQVIKRFGEAVKTRSLLGGEETADGQLLSLSYEMQNAGAESQKIKGKVVGKVLELDSEIAGKTTRRNLTLEEGVRAPFFPDRDLRAKPLKPGEERVYKVFDPIFDKVVTLTYKARESVRIPWFDGSERTALQATVEHSVIPALGLEEYFDEQGISIKTVVRALDIAVYKVPKAEALKGITGAELDLGISSLIKIRPIKNSHRTKQVVYRVRVPKEDVTRVLATGVTQSIKPVTADTVELTVNAVTPVDAPPAPPVTVKLDEFLQPSAMIQRDDKLVQDYAAEAAGDEKDPWRVCVKLEKWVNTHMRPKNSTLLASAGEVAKSLSGDCTEYAVLLTAMARARKIPARVAVGLTYDESHTSMAGHMWTEVFVNGRWYPLDATLGRGIVSADHIKHADSSLTDDEKPLAAFMPLIAVLKRLEIEPLRVTYFDEDH